MPVPFARIRFDNSGSGAVPAEYQLNADPPRPFFRSSPIPPGTSVEEVFPTPDGYAPVDVLRVRVVCGDGQHVCKESLEGPAMSARAVRDDAWLDLILFHDAQYEQPIAEAAECGPQVPMQDSD
jgi:hypothetical protein